MGKNSNQNNKRKAKKGKGGTDLDWIASLAKNSVTEQGGGVTILSKEDRKRKRELKKNKRLEAQQQKQLQRNNHPSTETTNSNNTKRKATKNEANDRSVRSDLLLRVSKPRLRRLSKTLESIRRVTYEGKKSRPVPYYDLPPKHGNAKACRTSHGCNKAPKKRKRWAADTIQPRHSDYSGIGLARNSMFLEFVDPSYFPLLEQEFQEHIPGFFGKQRTKAMKKQTDGNMLWRRMANEKQSKKFKGMTADERVKAMLESNDSGGLLG
jgi:hypothetical protein